MKAYCSNCGKETFLNEENLCFNCYSKDNVKKIKYARKMPKPSFEKKIYTVMIILNNILSMWLLIQNNFRFDASLIFIYFIAMIVVDGKRIHDAEEKGASFWPELVGNYIFKYIIFFITTKMHKQFVREQDPDEFRALKFFLLTWFIIMLLSLLIQYIVSNKKAKDYFRYSIYAKDKILEPMNSIPVSINQDWDNPDLCQRELQKAEQKIDALRVEPHVKQELRKLFHTDKGSLMVDNDYKYLYCSIMQELLKEQGLWEEQPQWFMDVPQSIKYMASFDEAVKKMPGPHYITEQYYTFVSRLRSEVCYPWLELTVHEKVIQERLHQFKMEDCISVAIGHDGESKVENLLMEYSDQIILLPNLRIEVDGNSIENDFVLISPYGIYVLEVKNLGSGGGYDLLIEQDGRWNKVYHNTTSPMSSVSAQNERHILYLEKYLNRKLNRTLDNAIRVDGIIVLANNVVRITNQSNHLILRYTDIMSTIRKNPVVMKESEMKQIAQLLQEVALPPLKYEMKNGFWGVYLRALIWREKYNQWYQEAADFIRMGQEYMD